MKKHLFLYFLSLFFLSCATTSKVITKDVRARLDLAQSYIMHKQPRLAMIELLKIRKEATNIPYYHFLKGLAYLETKEIKKAISSFSYAIKLNPSYGDAWNNLGLAYVAAGEEEKAIGCFKRALSIETYPTPEYAAHNLAMIYEKKGEIGKAIKYEKKALVLNWRYLPSYFSLSNLCIQKGDISCAIKWLKKGIEARPDNEKLYFLLGENYLRAGKTKEAKKAFTELLKLDGKKNSKLARMARDYLAIIK